MFLSASISTYNFVNTEVQITQERKINETSFRIQLIQFCCLLVLFKKIVSIRSHHLQWKFKLLAESFALSTGALAPAILEQSITVSTRNSKVLNTPLFQQIEQNKKSVTHYLIEKYPLVFFYCGKSTFDIFDRPDSQYQSVISVRD